MRVWNKRERRVPSHAVYVGRPTRYGNPFIIGVDGTRDEVVEMYEVYAREEFTREELLKLRGLDLVCWCAPLRCHADVLVKLVEELV